MRTLNITFTDEEYAKLVKAKKRTGYSNWHAFILNKISNGYSVKRTLKKRNLYE